MTQTIVEEKNTMQNLEKILKYDLNGKPKLSFTINEYPNFAINTQRKKDYDALMQVFECGDYKWNHENCLPTEFDNWDLYKEDYCVSILPRKGAIFYEERREVLAIDMRLISAYEFYETQKITSKMIKEINKWFDKNKPNRASRSLKLK